MWSEASGAAARYCGRPTSDAKSCSPTARGQGKPWNGSRGRSRQGAEAPQAGTDRASEQEAWQECKRYARDKAATHSLAACDADNEFLATMIALWRAWCYCGETRSAARTETCVVQSESVYTMLYSACFGVFCGRIACGVLLVQGGNGSACRAPLGQDFARPLPLRARSGTGYPLLTNST